MPGTRAEELARQFEQAVAEYLGVVDGLTLEQWRTLCPSEGRPIGVLTQHVAKGIPFEMVVFRAIAGGSPVSTITRAQLDQMNADDAAEWAECEPAETLADLRANAAAAAAEVRQLGDAQLDRSGKYIEELPEPWTVETWIARILTGHVTGHLRSVRAALGEPGGA